MGTLASRCVLCEEEEMERRHFSLCTNEVSSDYSSSPYIMSSRTNSVNNRRSPTFEKCFLKEKNAGEGCSIKKTDASSGRTEDLVPSKENHKYDSIVFKYSMEHLTTNSDVSTTNVESPTIQKHYFDFHQLPGSSKSPNKTGLSFWKSLGVSSRKSAKNEIPWGNSIVLGRISKSTTESSNDSHNSFRATGSMSFSKSTRHIDGYETWPRRSNQSLFMPSYPVDHKQLHKYQIYNKIGSGAYSEVFKVENKQTKDFFALKKLSKSKIISCSMLKQAQDEVSVLLRLGPHPFILGLISCWQSKGYLYQLLLYATKGDLHTLWTKFKPFSFECVRETTAEVATALDGKYFDYRFRYMNRRMRFCNKNPLMCIKTDFKCENYRRLSKATTKDGHIQLSDFGLSKFVGRLQRTETICGTLPYMAPEVASGNGYSYESDWWSLGVIVVAMYTGKLPFKPVHDHKELLNEIKQNIFDLTKLSDDLRIKDATLKLLNYRPWHRFSTMSEIEELKLFANYTVKDVLGKRDGPFLEYISTVVTCVHKGFSSHSSISTIFSSLTEENCVVQQLAIIKKLLKTFLFVTN